MRGDLHRFGVGRQRQVAGHGMSEMCRSDCSHGKLWSDFDVEPGLLGIAGSDTVTVHLPDGIIHLKFQTQELGRKPEVAAPEVGFDPLSVWSRDLQHAGPRDA